MFCVCSCRSFRGQARKVRRRSRNIFSLSGLHWCELDFSKATVSICSDPIMLNPHRKNIRQSSCGHEHEIARSMIMKDLGCFAFRSVVPSGRGDLPLLKTTSNKTEEHLGFLTWHVTCSKFSRLLEYIDE